MAKFQFDIRSLLISTAVIGCVLTFATQVSRTGDWLFALMVTVLLATVLAAIIALLIYVVAPIFK